MENFYKAYTKTINGVTFYFVKRFQSYPELKNASPFLENYGMHTDFYKACKIAMIEDKSIQRELLDTIKSPLIGEKIIPMNESKAFIYNLRKKQISLPGLLKLIRLR